MPSHWRNGWGCSTMAATAPWASRNTRCTASGDRPIKPERVVDSLNRHLPEGAIVVADPDVASTGTALMIWGAAVGAGLFVVGMGVAVGVGRARDRARVRALVEGRAGTEAGGTS